MAVLESSLLLPLPTGVVIKHVTLDGDHLLIQVEACGPLACCPLCARPARRIHSTYTRTLADLPCAGRPVILHLLVRKWYCEATDCPRRIFTERLSELVRPSARMTLRLSAALQAQGLATCGEGGARLGKRLGMRTSPTTLLRRVMELPEPPVLSVVQLGIDGWSFRRGKRFGAILVDLETHRVLDLLPDRSASTSAAWMQRAIQRSVWSAGIARRSLR